jgi:dihydrofolate synthase / folylpolyglutamate synthase
MTTDDPAFLDILERLSGLQNYERHVEVPYQSKSFDLDEFRVFLQELGNPQRYFASVLVTGTAGKGSTAVMISGILRAAGFRVGLYTSPHLVDIRERIQVDGEMILQADFSRIGEDILGRLHFQTARSKGSRTFFEVLTALGFQYFREKSVQIAVVEVGVGGRLDATNVVSPLVSVFTLIGVDHTHWLGRTRTEIAREKSGIIHPGSDVVTVTQSQAVVRVIEDRARECESMVMRQGRDFSLRHYRGVRSSLYYFRSPQTSIDNLTLGLNGGFQQSNAAAAIATILRLNRHGFPVSQVHIRTALASSRWAGRFHRLVLRYPGGSLRGREVILDGGHNPVSTRGLTQSLKAEFAPRKIRTIFAAARDKDAKKMLQLLGDVSESLVLTTFPGPRSRSPRELVDFCPPKKATTIKESGIDALKYLLVNSDEDDVILVTGSLFLVGDVLKNLAGPGGTDSDQIIIEADSASPLIRDSPSGKL